jgi:prephenate dehydratase
MSDFASSKSQASAPIAMPGARIAFQGEFGANSHIACNQRFPELEPLPCPTFEDAFAAIQEGRAEFGMIAIENSLYGRVADIHHLLPQSTLHIVGEHFLAIRFALLGVKGAKIGNIKRVLSHVQALGQCRGYIRNHGFEPVIEADTAGSARIVAERQDPTQAAIAPPLCGDMYGLDTLDSDIQDSAGNTTRFVIMAREPIAVDPQAGPVMTSIIFRVRNVPAALYKAMGGFATNGVNVTKLESYQLGGSFNATQFYAEMEGHPAERSVILALEELEFFSSHLRIMGVYAADPYRATAIGD